MDTPVTSGTRLQEAIVNEPIIIEEKVQLVSEGQPQARKKCDVTSSKDSEYINIWSPAYKSRGVKSLTQKERRDLVLKYAAEQRLLFTSSPTQEDFEIKYKAHQWSPFNPDGKRAYDRDLLLYLRNVPLSLIKPSNLPSSDIIKNEPKHTEKLDALFPELGEVHIQEEILKKHKNSKKTKNESKSDRTLLSAQKEPKSIERKLPLEENNSDHLEKEIESILNELLQNGNLQETEMRINKLARVASLSTIISEALDHVLESTSDARVKFGRLLSWLIACGTLSTSHLNESFRSTLESIEEHRLIVPNVPEYLGEIISQMIRVTPDMMLLKGLLRPCIPSLSAGRIVASTLRIVAGNCDRKYNLYLAGDLWRKSGYTWEEFLPDIDVPAFIESQEIKFILPISHYYLKEDPEMENVKRAVESLILSGRNERAMLDWIKQNVEEYEHNHEFFFILSSSVLEYIVLVASDPEPDYYHMKSKLLLLNLYSIAKKYLQAELIHACEYVVKKLNEPEGLFLELLRLLYHGNVRNIGKSKSFDWWKVTYEHEIKMEDIMNGEIFRGNSKISREVYVDTILLKEMTKTYGNVNMGNHPGGLDQKTVLSFPSIMNQLLEADNNSKLTWRKSSDENIMAVRFRSSFLPKKDYACENPTEE